MPKIEKLGSKILKKMSVDVNLSVENIDNLLVEMKRILILHNALGIAAPQIGANKRVILVKDVSFNKIITMINPRIIFLSDETEVDVEGCLSIDGRMCFVRRSKHIEIQYIGEDYVQKAEKYSGLNARIIQHEVDHLKGILMTDYGLN